MFQLQKKNLQKIHDAIVIRSNRILFRKFNLLSTSAGSDCTPSSATSDTIETDLVGGAELLYN